MTDIPELTDEQLKRAIPARLRRRLMQGRFESGRDIAALRSFVGLTQIDFARATHSRPTRSHPRISRSSSRFIPPGRSFPVSAGNPVTAESSPREAHRDPGYLSAP
jgi:hypothetical protein